MTDFMKLARRQGLVPDWVWYQINGQSATENWVEQHDKFMDFLKAEDDTPHFTFTSEVKIR